MVASNKQPCGSRPGPAGVHTHAPNQAGKPGSGGGNDPKSNTGVASHGTPKPTGSGKSNPLH